MLSVSSTEWLGMCFWQTPRSCAKRRLSGEGMNLDEMELSQYQMKSLIVEQNSYLGKMKEQNFCITFTEWQNVKAKTWTQALAPRPCLRLSPLPTACQTNSRRSEMVETKSVFFGEAKIISTALSWWDQFGQMRSTPLQWSGSHIVLCYTTDLAAPHPTSWET